MKLKDIYVTSRNEVVKITERAIKVDIPMGRDW